MKLKIEFNDKAESGIEESWLLKVAKKTLEESKLDFLKGKNIEISLAAVVEKEIQELNKKYRQQKFITDVLSFPEYETQEELKKNEDKNIFLGEVILCYNYITEYAWEKKIKVEEELARVIAHGILHLLGYEHGGEMFSIQDDVVSKLKF